MEEVSDKSGFSRSRSLDYMLVNLWESRGLAITGIEVKSNRSDWLRELKNPKKQENHYKYCDYFYLLTTGTTPTIALPEEIPVSWGWWQISDKGILKTIKPAPKLTSTPVDRSLLCAMLRRAATKDGYIHRSEIEDRIVQEAENQKLIQSREVARTLDSHKKLTQAVEEFCAETGLKELADFRSWTFYSPKVIGKAVKFILNHGIDHYKTELEGLHNRIERIYKNISETMEQAKSIDVSRETFNTND
jgi:hypothetical protein